VVEEWLRRRSVKEEIAEGKDNMPLFARYLK